MVPTRSARQVTPPGTSPGWTCSWYAASWRSSRAWPWTCRWCAAGAVAVHMEMHVAGAQAAQHVDAEQDQHHADGGVEVDLQRGRQGRPEHDDDGADGDERERMARAPESGERHVIAPRRGPGRERRNRGDVVGLERVLHPEQEAEDEQRPGHSACASVAAEADWLSAGPRGGRPASAFRIRHRAVAAPRPVADQVPR